MSQLIIIYSVWDVDTSLLHSSRCGEMNSGRWVLHHWGCICEVVCAITSALPGWVLYIHSLSWSTRSVRKSQLFQANVTAVWPFSVLLPYVSSSWSILACLRCQEYDTPTYLICRAVIPKVQNHVCAIKKAAPVSSLVKTTHTSLFNHIISVFAHWKKKKKSFYKVYDNHWPFIKCLTQLIVFLEKNF